MNKKSGITLTILMVAIIVMLIIMSSSIIIGSGYIADAKLDEYKTMIESVSNDVNVYILKNNSLPITNESILYTNYSVDFAKEVESKGDIQNKLYIVDVTKLEKYTLSEGRGSLSNNDIFVIAENTNNIYYLKGFKYKGKMQYGM